jgi:hypothetical protein
MAWDTRFKKASAAKKAAAEPPQPRRFDDDTVRAARNVDIVPLLQRRYGEKAVQLSNEGKRLSVQGVLRADLKDNTWVACDWLGEGIGDPIALTMHLDDVDFPTAVRQLTGMPAVQPRPVAQPAASYDIKYPKLPAVASIERGREYLTVTRGISASSVRAAEDAGVIRYSDHGVLFLGRDQTSERKSVRSATMRYFEPVEMNGDMVSKRDFKHSDKSFPAFLPGDPGRVIVVEGAINALAVRDIVTRRGEPAPTVVASGGVGMIAWTRNATIQAMLMAADNVEIWGENERGRDGQSDAKKQERTDSLRTKLAVSIGMLTGRPPALIYPPLEHKDAADWLQSGNPKNQRKQ